MPLKLSLKPGEKLVINGAVVVETIFGWPGIGRLMYDSIYTRDYPVLLGILLFVSVTVILVNLITDAFYAVPVRADAGGRLIATAIVRLTRLAPGAYLAALRRADAEDPERNLMPALIAASMWRRRAFASGRSRTVS